MKLFSLLMLAVAAFAVTGCGAGDNTTESENKAFKTGDKSAIKPPPPGANAPPANFKSSLGNEGGPVSGGN